jgi:hypothetical protein
MSKKHVLGAVIASLCLTACGGAPSEEADPAVSSQEQAVEKAWKPCTGREMFSRYFYSDAAQTNMVGRFDCSCDGSTYSFGTTSSYYEHVIYRTCR